MGSDGPADRNLTTRKEVIVMAKPKGKGKRARSAISGRFVTKKHAHRFAVH